MTSNSISSSHLKGLISVIAGIGACFIIGIPFLLKLFLTCLAFISLEYGLGLLQIPTIRQTIQKFITIMYRS